MLREILPRLADGATFTAGEMRQAIGAIMDGEATPAQVGALLMGLRLRGETAEEISGAAHAMRERMTRITVARTPLVDTCGTGGDGGGTFNISTAVAFVVAAGGVGVAKHGNRAVSSRSGSADVLEALGLNLDAPAESVRASIEEVGIGFIFAQRHHPAMRHAAPIRKDLGIRTLFNVLGPLTNPAGAKRQLLGVFAPDLTATLARALGDLGSERAWVVHGLDGTDELTVCGPSQVSQWDGQEVTTFQIAPEDVGLPRHDPAALAGGTPGENAALMRSLLAGELKGGIPDAVAFNAGAALWLADAAPDLSAGVAQAKDVLVTGRASTVLERMVAASRA